MEKLKEFTESFKFIVAFCIATIFVQMFLGNKFAENFLMLIIISAIFMNSDKFIKLLNGVNGK
jgi:hypothetical protein